MSMPGLKLVEMERNRNEQRCCGAGEGVKAGLPDLALAIAKDRMNQGNRCGSTDQHMSILQAQPPGWKGRSQAGNTDG